MTTRKTTTTRKRTTKAAPKKTVSREEVEDGLDEAMLASDEPRVVYVERGFNWNGCAIAVVVLMLAGMLVLCSGGAVYWYVAGGQPDVAPAPAPATPLAPQIRAAGVTPEHAVYFRKVCDGVANRIEADGNVSDPVFTSRSEIRELAGAAGSLAIAGNAANAYPALPPVIESAFADAWETNKDGELMGGPLTEKDRAAVVRIWRELALAFAEVAG